jgi:hypothetical protein
VVWGLPPHHWNVKRHCHSLTIYPASKTCCTQFAAPTSCLGHPVYIQSTDGRLSWSEAIKNASLTLTSLPHTHNRISPHCSHKTKTSCPTPALLRTETEALSGNWCNDLIMWHYSIHSVSHPWLLTLSCILVTALVTRYCHLWLKPYFEIGTHCTWKQPPVFSKQELNNNS